jgi:hypothetical protein
MSLHAVSSRRMAVMTSDISSSFGSARRKRTNSIISDTVQFISEKICLVGAPTHCVALIEACRRDLILHDVRI